MEEWKDVIGFPGYQVSSLGRVRTYNKVTSSAKFSVRHWRNRVLKQKVHRKDHYARVSLWKDGEEHTMLVHRLVACAFIPVDGNGMTVNHIDGNKSNNTKENLEWISLSDNIRHGFKIGLYTSQKPCSLVDQDNNKYTFRSQSEASRFLGRNNGYVNECIAKNKNPKNKDGKVYTIGDSPCVSPNFSTRSSKSYTRS